MFRDGLKLIEENINLFKKMVYHTYLSGGDQILLEPDYNLIFIEFKEENLYQIGIISEFRIISFIYIVASKKGETDWKFNKSQLKELITTCDGCDQDITFDNKKMYVLNKYVEIENGKDTYDLCPQCYELGKGNYSKSEFNEVDFNQELSYFPFNLIEISRLKYFTNINTLNQGFIIKDFPKYDSEKLSRYNKIIKKMFDEQTPQEELDKLHQEYNEIHQYISDNFKISHLTI